MILAFTGHRPPKLGGYAPNPLADKVQEEMLYLVEKLQPEVIITGMALGVDQWAATIADFMKIPFWAYLPCDGQEATWPEKSQKTHHKLLEKAAKVQIVSPGPYAAWKMQARNVAMVDDCTDLAAIWDGTEGGTANCVKYCQTTWKNIHRINPKELL